MSDKARRSNAWDDQHLSGILWPVKALVRAFSSITLAVILLVLVMLYGISASVPVGLLALAPTYLLYGLTFVLAVGLASAGPVLLVSRGLSGRGRGLRFLAGFATFVVLGGLGVFVWVRYVWPQINYDAGTGHGLRLFAAFVEGNKATTLRRLPGMEMSELEYYAWWPLRVILLAFVLNMIVATVRRIEFTFRNIGVLTVHTGIVTIALGSVYYSGLKQEGDTLLLAGDMDAATGQPKVGPAQNVFYDNTRVSLYVSENVGMQGGWEQRPLSGVPRYNDYNLDAFTGTSALAASGRWDPHPDTERPLAIPVPASGVGVVDPDISMKIVGYAGYADPVTDYVQALPAGPEGGANPLRIVYLYDLRTGRSQRAYAFTLLPSSPAERISSSNGAFSVEYTAGPSGGMTAQRWQDLSEQLPAGTNHALVVDVPAADGRPASREVYPVSKGTDISVGETGFKLQVKDLSLEPPFPIITEGYRGATSSVAVVTVTPPKGAAYDRYVYHRFPQINQDMLQELNSRGMPKRRDADPSIRISLIEADQIYVYFDEPTPGGPARALVRLPGGQALSYDGLPDKHIPLVDKIELGIGERWENCRKVERPEPVPAENQEKNSIGTHDHAMLAVEVSATLRGDNQPWNDVVWLPFTRYMGLGMGTERRVDLPDGRSLELAFGRLQHELPGFAIRLVDFQMLAYDHRGSPRDYQSIVRVIPTSANFEGFEHVTKLNNPLRAPFEWDDSKSWFKQIVPKLASGMNPNQFKFSQAGWDQSGWAKTQAQADAGMIKRPFASFTILGVGNNPGIHLIAAGGVMMGLGIPWAFYVKPWLVRREKKKIQAAVAAGTYRKPEREAVAAR